MKLEVVVSAKQANPVYTGFPRNGQGKMDDSLDNPDMDDRSKVECKKEDDCDGIEGARCNKDCINGHCQVGCVPSQSTLKRPKKGL